MYNILIYLVTITNNYMINVDSCLHRFYVITLILCEYNNGMKKQKERRKNGENEGWERMERMGKDGGRGEDNK